MNKDNNNNMFFFIAVSDLRCCVRPIPCLFHLQKQGLWSFIFDFSTFKGTHNDFIFIEPILTHTHKCW